MTRATKRDVGRDELRDGWQRQAVDIGLDEGALTAGTRETPPPPPAAVREAVPEPVPEDTTAPAPATPDEQETVVRDSLEVPDRASPDISPAGGAWGGNAWYG